MDGLLNRITSLDFENCISSGDPAHKSKNGFLDEKGDLFAFLEQPGKWGKSKIKSGTAVIALESSCI